MNIELTITGGGNTKEVAAALRQIASDIEFDEDLHEDIESKGKYTIEDGTLLAEISESID